MPKSDALPSVEIWKLDVEDAKRSPKGGSNVSERKLKKLQMLLTKLVVQYFGPFGKSTEIRFESDVTVFTGTNDSGKTSVLNLVELVCSMGGNARVLQEGEVNSDWMSISPKEWKNDTEIKCEAWFKGSEYSLAHTHGTSFGPGGEIVLDCIFAPGCRKLDRVKLRRSPNQGWSIGDVEFKDMPSLIRIPFSDTIRSVIDLEFPNGAELAFLQAAFGSQFTFQKYASLSDGRFFAAVSKARGDINKKLERFLPSALSMEFDLQTMGEERNKLSVQLRDKNSAHTPMSCRGRGIQYLISVMAALLSQPLADRHVIILIDEPENSLHADAQHALRAMLEGIAERPNIQVIYATHSPCMINPIRTSALRLVRRENLDDVPTTVIDHRPIDENFLSIRSSLGITPSDSLLYAPVTLIVEGPTEVIGLPIILGRLWKEKISGFEDAESLLSRIHILDGCGDSFDVLCKFAVSQGTRPVIFLDGDKAGTRLNKVKNRFPHVPIVHLDGRREFEEIVPQSQYFDSLAKVGSCEVLGG